MKEISRVQNQIVGIEKKIFCFDFCQHACSLGSGYARSCTATDLLVEYHCFL